MSSTMWYIMQSIQSKYSLSERLIRTIAAIRSFPHDNVEDLIRKVGASVSPPRLTTELKVSHCYVFISSVPQGADVNRMHGTLKPLHCACMVADADCVELLLEKGAEVGVLFPHTNNYVEPHFSGFEELKMFQLFTHLSSYFNKLFNLWQLDCLVVVVAFRLRLSEIKIKRSTQVEKVVIS